jgi:deoxyribonucleoside regulator
LGEGHLRDPSENGVLLLAEVARLYYLNHLTQQHIAERLRVSRSKVSRMLSEARASGLVDIRVHSPLTRTTARPRRCCAS